MTPGKNPSSLERVLVYLAVAVFLASSILFFIKAREYKPRPRVKVIIKKEKPKVKIKPVYRPRAAIVVDDFGYSMNNVETLISTGAPVTFSILPNLPYSAQIARRARDSGHECILHLPMEPKESQRVELEKDTILVSMTDAEIRRIINQDISSLGGIIGINNHMGSRATENQRTMDIVLQELKMRRLIFLNSYVTGSSLASRTARRLGMPYLQRDVFLDNKMESAYIKEQMRRLIRIAQKKGSAVGIGHDRPLTIECIRQMLPEFERAGVKLVKLSELLKP